MNDYEGLFNKYTQNGSYLKKNNEQIFFRTWSKSEPDKVKTAILIIHGIGYHSLPYKIVWDYLSSPDIAVFAIDLRGHGLSKGVRGTFESVEIIMNDIEKMVQHISIEYPNSKIILLGESMGGAFALRYALNSHNMLSGLILVAPAIITHKSQIYRISNFKYLMAFFCNRKNPIIYIDGTQLDESSRDLEFVNSKRNDPLAIHYVSLDYLQTISNMQKYIKDENLLKELHIPVLILHGEKDVVNDISGSYYLKNCLPNSVVELYTFDNSYHTLFWDNDTNLVFDKIKYWLLKL